MLEVSNIKVHVAPLRKHPAKESKVGFDALLRALRVSADEITSYELHKRSIDARKRNDIVLILTYHVTLKGGSAAEQKLLSKIQGRPAAKHIKLAEPNTFALPKATQPAPSENRPVVVGAGCAGLFCALTLAKAGLNPLLIERGDDATRRTAAVEHHNQTGQLDLESNIQFGLGGAGTFSDGKLNTGTKSASHRFILETFVKAGAQKNILWDAKPHVGSDVLPAVVTNIVTMIEEAGGTVAFRTKLASLERASDGSLSAIQIEKTNPD
ncbi:MAG: NAD(P)-binding protein, partial [Atopobium sp.]|nr:NAD(P)-binding protein [Atopobium sp.]